MCNNEDSGVIDKHIWREIPVTEQTSLLFVIMKKNLAKVSDMLSIRGVDLVCVKESRFVG